MTARPPFPGLPAAGSSGTYSFSITATNGVSPDATQTFTLTVQSAPAITSAASTTFIEGSAGTFTVTSTGFPTAALSEVGTLPSGVNFVDNGDGTATLSGTPATGSNGVYSFSIKAINGVSPNATQILHPHGGRGAGVHVGELDDLRRGQRGLVHADGQRSPDTDDHRVRQSAERGDLLARGPLRYANGKRVASRSSSPQTTVSVGQVTQNFTLTVNGPLTFKTTTLPSGTKKVAYSYTLQATGGTRAVQMVDQGLDPAAGGTDPQRVDGRHLGQTHEGRDVQPHDHGQGCDHIRPRRR